MRPRLEFWPLPWRHVNRSAAVSGGPWGWPDELATWGAPSRRQWGKVRLKVLDRDGWRCQKCGKAGRLEVDHIKALEHGGAVYDESNLQTLCRGCHLERHRGRAPDPEVAKWRRYLTNTLYVVYTLGLTTI